MTSRAMVPSGRGGGASASASAGAAADVLTIAPAGRIARVAWENDVTANVDGLEALLKLAVAAGGDPPERRGFGTACGDVLKFDVGDCIKKISGEKQWFKEKMKNQT